MIYESKEQAVSENSGAMSASEIVETLRKSHDYVLHPTNVGQDAKALKSEYVEYKPLNQQGKPSKLYLESGIAAIKDSLIKKAKRRECFGERSKDHDSWMNSEGAEKARVALMLRALSNELAVWPLQCMATTVAKKRCGSKGTLLIELECGRQVRLCKLHGSLASTPEKIEAWPAKSVYASRLEQEIEASSSKY